MKSNIYNWPVRVCFVRNSPLSQIVEGLQYSGETKCFELPLHYASSDCDYYLASAFLRYKRITKMYNLMIADAENTKDMMYKLHGDPEGKIKGFNSPSAEAYLTYMEFDAYVNAVRTAQDKLLRLIRPIVSHEHNYNVPESMHNYVGKQRNDDFYRIVKKYWLSSGKSLRDYRVLVTHNDRITPWPSYKYDCESNHLYQNNC